MIKASALEEAILNLSTMTAENIRATYPSTNQDPSSDYANMILLLALMRTMNIAEIEILRLDSSLMSILLSDDLAW